MECFAKRIMTECRCTTKKFSGQGRFPGTRTFHQKKKKTRKEVPTGKYFGFFSLKTTFWMENLIQRWTQSGLFSPKNQDTLHQQLRNYECSWIFINVPKYPRKCLNKLFWLCQSSECVWSFYMFDRLLKMPQVLNVPWFWMWHGCICKDHTKFWMSRYGSIHLSDLLIHTPECPRTCLNMAEYYWSLNMPK